MRQSVWLQWQTGLFALTVLAFLSPPVRFINQIFGVTERWLVLGALAVIMLLLGGLLRVHRTDVGRWLLLMVAWGLATTLWSQEPQLSAMKSLAFLLVTTALVSAGRAWVYRAGLERSLDYLLPVVGLAVFAAAMGPTLAPEVRPIKFAGGVTLYQGLVGNPNMLGSLMAMAVPVVLWRLYRAGHSRLRWTWLGVLGGLVTALLLANSRAALLAALTTGFSMILALDLRRRQRLLSVALLGALFLVAATPALFDTVVTRYVYKGVTKEQGLLVTREEVWEESWKLALAGGWLGGGYGVTIGETGFTGGLSTAGYGREKGNTQMAIMEETGIVGLILYAGFLLVLFRRLGRAFAWVAAPHEKVLLGLLIGTLAGFSVQGIFEAWWVAPGSPEAAFWWAFVGVAVGVTQVLGQRYWPAWQAWRYPPWSPVSVKVSARSTLSSAGVRPGGALHDR